MPILHKNWEVIRGESLNFNVDYRYPDPIHSETLIPIDLSNYTARMSVKKNGSTLFEITEPTDIFKNAEAGHLEITISPARVLTIVSARPIDYVIYLDNNYDSSDKYAILRGRIKVVTSV